MTSMTRDVIILMIEGDNYNITWCRDDIVFKNNIQIVMAWNDNSEYRN